MAKKHNDQVYTIEVHEAYREKVEPEKRKEAADCKERVTKEHARRQWLRGNGDEATFEKQWPSIYEQIQKEQREERIKNATREDTAAREAQRRSRVSSI